MLGEVTVLAADADYAFTQADWDADAEAEKAAHIAAMAADRPEKVIELTDLGDGSREYLLRAGISTANADLMWLEEPDLTVYAGDTVRWTWDFTFAPHTVTFIPDGQTTPAFVLVEPQAAGSPTIIFNPVAIGPAGGATHSSTELANSGMLFNPLVGPPGAPGTYSLKFEETGSKERPDMVGKLFFVDICWSGILRLLYGTCS